ncbi:hypothetical protein CC86DRAFT_472983 [Ophiobolus disseminans]|uniref:Zn(2)-C6 fungal-type domain-containing protein n=1 Tax=Ophiobolus disseminans TaxID=1469910 RepID=A0A6A6ZBF5_9PLEO|nr:hypothetical protein CC86DRAFT_472983 [Ophiobolus disseminans]
MSNANTVTTHDDQNISSLTSSDTASTQNSLLGSPRRGRLRVTSEKSSAIGKLRTNSKIIKRGSGGRDRIAQACDRCRARKIRCDGLLHGCTPCGKAGVGCVTTKGRRACYPGGYTKLLEEQVELLQAKTRELEDQLDKANQTFPPSPVSYTSPLLQPRTDPEEDTATLSKRPQKRQRTGQPQLAEGNGNEVVTETSRTAHTSSSHTITAYESITNASELASKTAAQKALTKWIQVIEPHRRLKFGPYHHLLPEEALTRGSETPRWWPKNVRYSEPTRHNLSELRGIATGIKEEVIRKRTAISYETREDLTASGLKQPSETHCDNETKEGHKVTNRGMEEEQKEKSIPTLNSTVSTHSVSFSTAPTGARPASTVPSASLLPCASSNFEKEEATLSQRSRQNRQRTITDADAPSLQSTSPLFHVAESGLETRLGQTQLPCNVQADDVAALHLPEENFQHSDTRAITNPTAPYSQFNFSALQLSGPGSTNGCMPAYFSNECMPAYFSNDSCAEVDSNNAPSALHWTPGFATEQNFPYEGDALQGTSEQTSHDTESFNFRQPATHTHAAAASASLYFVTNEQNIELAQRLRDYDAALSSTVRCGKNNTMPQARTPALALESKTPLTSQDTALPSRQPSTEHTLEVMKEKGKTLKSFKRMQPTFVIKQPITSVDLQFLDYNNPEKDNTVREQARSWVNDQKHKDITLSSDSAPDSKAGRKRRCTSTNVDAPYSSSRLVESYIAVPGPTSLQMAAMIPDQLQPLTVPPLQQQAHAHLPRPPAYPVDGNTPMSIGEGIDASTPLTQDELYSVAEPPEYTLDSICGVRNEFNTIRFHEESVDGAHRDETLQPRSTYAPTSQTSITRAMGSRSASTESWASISTQSFGRLNNSSSFEDEAVIQGITASEQQNSLSMCFETSIWTDICNIDEVETSPRYHEGIVQQSQERYVQQNLKPPEMPTSTPSARLELFGYVPRGGLHLFDT